MFSTILNFGKASLRIARQATLGFGWEHQSVHAMRGNLQRMCSRLASFRGIANQQPAAKALFEMPAMALDHKNVYEHATEKQFTIRTTANFDEAMTRTNPREIFLYFPESMNYETWEEPFLTREDFHAWAKKGNRFSEHNIQVGLRYQGHRIFHGLPYDQKLFAHKNFVTTFSLDSITDAIYQVVEKSPGTKEIKFLKQISSLLASLVKTDGAEKMDSAIWDEEAYPGIFERVQKFLGCYKDLMTEAELLFDSAYVQHLRELWARYILATAAEVTHKVHQSARGLSIHPWFWGSIRPFSGAFILTGSLMYAREAQRLLLDDPLEHDIHMVDVYDNEILSFHKEQSQSHFNMINGLMTQGLSKDAAFMSWVRKRNIHCRDVEVLIEANRATPLEESYRRLFRYQVDLFNYHIWCPHRYGWSIQ